ncbi:MAG TPA: HlyD family efflux transporter periplasmic adaptor subunit [Melioribacteraceae bacterium]|nr:HlyD family efflux transporter periplasmic adaptor subunit [Melioribacteraceae bacterium]
MDKPINKSKWSKNKVSYITGILLFVVFMFYVFIIRDNSTKLIIDKNKITIFEVQENEFQEYIAVIGSVEPIETFFLDLTEGGRIVEKYIEEGAFVEVGQKIIKLDNPNMSLQLLNTQSNFILAENQFSQTRLTFEQNFLYKENQLLELNTRLLNQKRVYLNNKALYDKKLCSENEFSQSKDEYEYLVNSKKLMQEAIKKDSLTYILLLQQNETNVARSKEYLKLVEEQLNNLTVKSPIKGQLTDLSAEIGQTVTSGYKLGRIDNTDSYKIKAEVDEHYINRIKKGLTGEYELDGEKIELIVKTIYPQVNNGKFNIDLMFVKEQPKNLRRGLTTHIKLQLGNPTKSLVLENGGFYTKTGGEWVFILDNEERTAIRQKITLGRQNPVYFEILDGLKSGDKVITSSYDNYGETEKLILK